VSTTLTYGQIVPATGDTGATFWSNLEDNFTRIDSHDHDGSNSKQLTVSSVTGVTDTIASGSWALVANGIYRQLVTMPTGMNYDDFNPVFRDASGHILFLTVEKNSVSSYYVYINDNSVTLTVLYA